MNSPDDYWNGKKPFGDLLLEARHGSVEAKNELFVQVQTYLKFVASQKQSPKLSAKAGASDIVQQSLLLATEDFDQFRGDTEEQFRGWLRQIVLNQTSEQHRHYTAQRRDARQERHLQKGDSTGLKLAEQVDLQLTPCSEAMAIERSARIRRCLDDLPPELREVLHLRNWERLPFREIGERMGVSTSVAAKLWYRGLIEIQRLYEKSE